MVQAWALAKMDPPPLNVGELMHAVQARLLCEDQSNSSKERGGERPLLLGLSPQVCTWPSLPKDPCDWSQWPIRFYLGGELHLMRPAVSFDAPKGAIERIKECYLMYASRP